MDISYKYENQKFNYRVCAMIISGNKILAMHDERSLYFYLPGGRVTMGETAEQAQSGGFYRRCGWNVLSRIVYLLFDGYFRYKFTGKGKHLYFDRR